MGGLDVCWVCVALQVFFSFFSWDTNWAATCVYDDTSRHTCYPHRGWETLKEAWLLCQASCEKERERMECRKRDWGGKKNCWGCGRLVGEKTAPSHDLHAPSTIATRSTNIGMASRGHGNVSTSGSISPFLVGQDVAFIREHPVEEWRNLSIKKWGEAAE